jgi:hypothetical protein
MKKITLTLAVVFACFLTFAQQFSDNFDSYTSGFFLGPQSPFWTTGSGIEGGDADALVSSINTYSSSNSIYLHDQTNNGTAQLIRLDVGQVFEEGVFTFETALNVSAGQSAIISLMDRPLSTVSRWMRLNTRISGEASLISVGHTNG